MSRASRRRRYRHLKRFSVEGYVLWNRWKDVIRAILRRDDFVLGLYGFRGWRRQLRLQVSDPWEGNMPKFENRIVEFHGSFYLATWDEQKAQYSGPLRDEIAKATGCSGFFCRQPQGLPGAGGYRYNSRASAVRKARQIWGEE